MSIEDFLLFGVLPFGTLLIPVTAVVLWRLRKRITWATVFFISAAGIAGGAALCSDASGFFSPASILGLSRLRSPELAVVLGRNHLCPGFWRHVRFGPLGMPACVQAKPLKSQTERLLWSSTYSRFGLEAPRRRPATVGHNQTFTTRARTRQIE